MILPGDQALAPGERRTLVFADKSEKRALKQVMKGGAQGKAGKVFCARGGALGRCAARCGSCASGPACLCARVTVGSVPVRAPNACC